MQDFERRRSIGTRAVAPLSLALGLLSYWGWAWMPTSSSMAGDVDVWITDRGAGALVGLDGELIERVRVSLPAPTETESTPAGGAWVVTTPAGGPLGPHTLVAIERTGARVGELQLRTVLDLASDGAGEAWVVDNELGGDERILHVPWTGPARELARVPGARTVAAAWSEILVGTSDGDLVRFSREPAWTELSRVRIGGSFADLAPRRGARFAADSGPGWWILDAASPGRLVGLDAELRPQVEVELGMQALHLAPDPRGGVWIADASQPFVRRYGPNGELELERGELPLGGLDRGAAWGDGGVLLVAPGALLHLDAEGETLPGQGGFDFLVDVAPLP